MIISIDPHKNKVASAAWRDEILIEVGLIKGSQAAIKHWIRICPPYDTAIIEKMQIYAKERIKNPNDLLEVSKVVGMCHFLGETVVEYLPREWKGQTPKKVMHGRIKNALSPIEIGRLGRYTNQSDVLDAVGIGLKYLRRI